MKLKKILEQVSNITPTSGEKMGSMGGEIKNNFKGTLDGELIDFTFKGGEGDSDDIKNIEISFKNEVHIVDFKFDEIVFEDEDIHEAIFLAKSDDGMWDFEMTVQVSRNFESGQCNPCIIEYPYEVDGNSGTYLKITKAEDPRMDPAIRSDFDDPVMEEDMEEGTCGYGKDGKIGKKPAGPNMLQERFKKLAGLIK